MNKSYLTLLISALSIFFLASPSQNQDQLKIHLTRGGEGFFRLETSEFYVDISGDGKFLDLGTYMQGSVGVDTRGRINRLGNTYIRYDYANRITNIGNLDFYYDKYSRLYRIGHSGISYNYDGNISQINGKYIYWSNGRITRAGTAEISYNYSGRLYNIYDPEGLIVFKPAN